ncbi:MAG: ammonium transporter [Desulfocurvibacter africanus]
MSYEPVDLLWVLMAASLVFLMQAGFMCLETGLTRTKNSINVAIKNLADFVISVFTFWGVGYGLMFGASMAGIVGWSHYALPLNGEPWLAAFFFFQAMFCGTATTIFSGAVAERMRFSAYVIVSFIVSALIYPLFGHWAWSGLGHGELTGWLGAMGFVDFAGSTVVHSVGGWVSLAALLIIGPRQGRFDAQGRPREMTASNLPLSVLGAMLLWFGWFGFNGGSTLALTADVPLIIARTTLAGAMGGLSCLGLGWLRTSVPRVAWLINGVLGGLVAITAGCHVVDATGAAIIGLVAGPVCLASERLLERLRIDDAIGAVPVHLACGIWGTLAVALLGNPELIGTGLTRAGQLQVQILGIGAACGVSFVLTYLLLRLVNRVHPLRVSPDDEAVGLNISEHGARNDLADLFMAMDQQAATGDLSLRVPEEPFSEAGLIARRYNQVMDALESAVTKTEAIVRTAADAIVTFGGDSLLVMGCNPAAEAAFGYNQANLAGKPLSTILGGNGGGLMRELLSGRSLEVLCHRADGSRFPAEALVTEATTGSERFCIGTFRDITERRRAEEILRSSKTMYKTLFENSGTALFVAEADGCICLVNSEFESFSGYGRDEIEALMTYRYFFMGEALETVERCHDLFREGVRRSPQSFEAVFTDRLGAVKPVYVTIAIFPGTSRALFSLMDLSDVKQAEQALVEQRAFFQELFESSPLGIMLLDTEGQILNVNRGLERLFGYGREELRGHFSRSALVPEERAMEAENFFRLVVAGRPFQSETWRKHKNGELIPVSVVGYPVLMEGKIKGVYSIFSDISERKAFEEQLTHQAFHDALTGLPNRLLFHERLARALERAKRRPDYRFAVLLIDLDRFKWVNDSLGHMAGDELLVGISRRMECCLRSMDTVARLGGDEFGVLLEEFGNHREVVQITKRILSVIEEPFIVEGTTVFTSASIGMVLRTREYMSAEDLLRDADIAMYRAKEMGKARFKVFNRLMHENAVRVLRLETELRHAVQNEELRVHYQPIVSVLSGRLEGFEALARWEHPVRGLVQPAEFIPLAEETGLIVSLGKWILTEACRQLACWDVECPEACGLNMSVNISGKQLMQEDLVEFIQGVLRETGIAPQRLKLEITESVVMQDVKATVDKLNELKALGLALVIDDFGTGYSSLSYLQRFPIDMLKIDRSFISGLQGAGDNLEIIRTILSLARNLGLGVVAEGVELASQLQTLRDLDCDEAQGFMFSRPVAREEAKELILRLLAKN